MGQAAAGVGVRAVGDRASQDPLFKVPAAPSLLRGSSSRRLGRAGRWRDPGSDLSAPSCFSGQGIQLLRSPRETAIVDLLATAALV